MTLAVPPVVRSEPPRWRRMVPPALVAGGLGAATLALHLRDPHEQGSWGICPTAAMGIWCPGCGGLRSVNLLSNADIVGAASSNLLFVTSLPLIAYVCWRWSAGRWAGRPWLPSDRALTVWATVFGVLLVAFTLARNMPVGSWLAP